MQISNRVRKYAFIFAAAVLAFNSFAQKNQNSATENPAMPEMPDMPDMPDMPTVGGAFYTPSFPSRTQNNTATSSENQSTNTQTSLSSQSKKGETVITNADSNTDILSSLIKDNQILTAKDISSLHDSGLFDSLTSLNSVSNAGISNYATTSSTNVLLQQILNRLNELKSVQKNADSVQKEALQDTQTDSQTFKKRQPSILRFKINGYNIADSLSDVFFSKTEPDGTFLLTGDRKYYTNQKTRTETFYFLFKAVSTNGSSVTYKVQPSIVQDSKNENSFVYKLAETKNLTAEKTGNLVIMHFSDKTLSADLLLNIDN